MVSDHLPLQVLWSHGDTAVVEVNPLALVRFKAGAKAGAAWQSTKDHSWRASRPDREGGRVRTYATRKLALLYLTAEVN